MPRQEVKAGARRAQRPVSEGPADPLSHAVEARDRSITRTVGAAIDRRDLFLAFQPVVQAAQPDRVAFYEALVRLRDDTGRVIPARDFVAAVEDSELGRLLDCHALELGLRELAEIPDLRLSVNLSARSIGYRRWLSVLQRGLARDRTVAERLILEITEHSAMSVPELVGSFMRELQRRGLSFALDDFGAGQTSLRHLRDLYFDILKIDGQFVQGIADSADNQVLVQAVLGLARQFEMFTVAERVEDKRDAARLAALGIDCMQGYLYGAPTPLPPWRQDSQARATA